jgi:E3 ubiquitin-protein ligase SIAH1
MAALQSGGEATGKRARDPTAPLTLAAEHSESAGVRKEKKGFSAPAAAPAPVPKSAAAPLVDVTVEDAATMDCGVCYHPLKRPFFPVIDLHEHSATACPLKA